MEDLTNISIEQEKKKEVKPPLTEEQKKQLGRFRLFVFLCLIILVLVCIIVLQISLFFINN